MKGIADTVSGRASRLSAPLSDTVFAARGIGMILVVFGHYLENLAYVGHFELWGDWRILYRFHIPLFFVLVGITLQSREFNLSRVTEIWSKRMKPVINYSLVASLLGLLVGFKNIREVSAGLGATIFGGIPVLIKPMWFLTCLLFAELIILFSRIKQNALFSNLCKAVLLALIASIVINLCGAERVQDIKLALRFYYWPMAAFSASIIICSFSANWKRILDYYRELNLSMRFILGFLLAFLLLAGSNRVNFAGFQIGNPALLFINSLGGSGIVLILSYHLKNKVFLNLVGKHSLAILGLNGLSFSFLDPWICRLLAESLPRDHSVGLLSALALSIAWITSVSIVLTYWERFVKLIKKRDYPGLARS